MVNVYDSANQLAEDLQQTPEYHALQKAIGGVKQDNNSTALFKKMDEIQNQIISAQQKGQSLSSELQQEYQDLSKKVKQDPNIVKMLQAEQGLYKLIDDVQKTFTRPISDLYEGLKK